MRVWWGIGRRRALPDTDPPDSPAADDPLFSSASSGFGVGIGCSAILHRDGFSCLMVRARGDEFRVRRIFHAVPEKRDDHVLSLPMTHPPKL